MYYSSDGFTLSLANFLKYEMHVEQVSLLRTVKKIHCFDSFLDHLNFFDWLFVKLDKHVLVFNLVV